MNKLLLSLTLIRQNVGTGYENSIEDAVEIGLY
jgi:hypothetical protein